MYGTIHSQLVTAVSGKTSYLIAGSVLEDGRPATDGSKYRAAMDKNVTLSIAAFLYHVFMCVLFIGAHYI